MNHRNGNYQNERITANNKNGNNQNRSARNPNQDFQSETYPEFRHAETGRAYPDRPVAGGYYEPQGRNFGHRNAGDYYHRNVESEQAYGGEYGDNRQFNADWQHDQEQSHYASQGSREQRYPDQRYPEQSYRQPQASSSQYDNSRSTNYAFDSYRGQHRYDSAEASNPSYGYGDQNYGASQSGSRYGYGDQNFAGQAPDYFGSQYAPGMSDRSVSYRGKGPKGYERSDERLKEDISERLMHDAHIDASDIEIQCKGGVITLEGSISDRRAKHHAENIIESISGVKDIDNRLKISDASGKTSVASPGTSSGATNGSKK
jgi:osmotically-inducible protein OsmY